MTQKNLSELKSNIIDLSKLNCKLHQILLAISVEFPTQKEFAEKLGLSYTIVSKFFLQKKSLCSEYSLSLIDEFLKNRNIELHEIENAKNFVKNTYSRWLSVLFWNISKIELIFDLFIAYEQFKERISINDFAKIFEENERIIKYILRYEFSTIEEIFTNESENKIVETLCLNNWEQLVENSILNKQNYLKELTSKLFNLCNDLYSHFNNWYIVAKKLNTSTRTIQRVLKNDPAQLNNYISIENLETMIKLAEETILQENTLTKINPLETQDIVANNIFIPNFNENNINDIIDDLVQKVNNWINLLLPFYETKKILYTEFFNVGKISKDKIFELINGKTRRGTPPKKEYYDEFFQIAEIILSNNQSSEHLKQEPQSVTDTLIDDNSLAKMLESFGGGISPLGVPYSLTAENFTDIDFNPNNELVNFTQRQIRLVRALLNMFSQLKDKETRELVRKQISPETEELKISIELFTHSHPNNLTTLYDAQRATWTTTNNKKKGAY